MWIIHAATVSQDVISCQISLLFSIKSLFDYGMAEIASVFYCSWNLKVMEKLRKLEIPHQFAILRCVKILLLQICSRIFDKKSEFQVKEYKLNLNSMGSA